MGLRGRDEHCSRCFTRALVSFCSLKRLTFRAKSPSELAPLAFKFFLIDTFPYGNIMLLMPRAATTTDVFNAIAEPRRREIIDVLVDGKEHAVGEMVEALRIPQPAASKHLAVLRKVGIVSVTKRGQLRLYRLDAKQLKPVHDWVKKYERFWAHHLDRIRQRA